MFDGYHAYVRFNDFSVLEPVRVFKTLQELSEYAKSIRRTCSSVETVGCWWETANNVRVGWDDVTEMGL